MKRILRLFAASIAVVLCMQAAIPAVSETVTALPEVSTAPNPAITLPPSHQPEPTAAPVTTDVLPPVGTPLPAATAEPTEMPEVTAEPDAAPSSPATPETDITPVPPITAAPEADTTPEPAVSPSPEGSIELEATRHPGETGETIEEAPSLDDLEIENNRKQVRRNKKIGWRGVVHTDERGMSIPMLFQTDYRETVCYYNDTPKSVSTSGCGAVCVSMVIAYLTGNTEQNPYKLFCDAVDNGYYKGNGLSKDVLTLMAAEYGIKSQWINNDANAIIKALKEGKPVIAHMGKGIFTETGHYIVLRGVTEDGKILLNDPYNYSNCFKAYPIRNLLREARTSRSFMICWVDTEPSAAPEN